MVATMHTTVQLAVCHRLLHAQWVLQWALRWAVPRWGCLTVAWAVLLPLDMARLRWACRWAWYLLEQTCTPAVLPDTQALLAPLWVILLQDILQRATLRWAGSLAILPNSKWAATRSKEGLEEAIR